VYSLVLLMSVVTEAVGTSSHDLSLADMPYILISIAQFSRSALLQSTLTLELDRTSPHSD
jgi:hypothetical protein